MAFHSDDLSMLAGANGFTLWHYTTSDETVDDDGYFNAASAALRVGDVIIAGLDVAGTPRGAMYLVTSNFGGVVGTSDMMQIIGSR